MSFRGCQRCRCRRSLVARSLRLSGPAGGVDLLERGPKCWAVTPMAGSSLTRSKGSREVRPNRGHDVDRSAEGHYPRRICHLTGPASIRSPSSLSPVSIQCKFLLCKPKSNNSRDSELV